MVHSLVILSFIQLLFSGELYFQTYLQSRSLLISHYIVFCFLSSVILAMDYQIILAQPVALELGHQALLHVTIVLHFIQPPACLVVACQQLGQFTSLYYISIQVLTGRSPTVFLDILSIQKESVLQYLGLLLLDVLIKMLLLVMLLHKVSHNHGECTRSFKADNV